MKRKLDENGAPTIEVSASSPDTPIESFESLKLDARILQAVAKSQFSVPTPVQAKTIPLALEGKDILAKSKTGSGKTAAYVLPTIQAILRRKATAPKSRVTSALVLVPTWELAEQVHKAFETFVVFCSKEVRSVNLTQRVSDAVLHAILSDSPEVVVSTPGRAIQFLATGNLSLSEISHLVIDEADLVLSYDYEDDINTIKKAIPHGVQTFLMSATLTPEVETLKTIFCRDPIIVKIEEKEDEGNGMTQYVVKCAEDEKFLLIFVIFKLHLVRGKCIVFVENVDRSYRLKLFLEQFGIKSCVLNSELPINSRLHAVQEFNKGLYEILIAADDQEVLGGVAKKPKSKASEADIPVKDTAHPAEGDAGLSSESDTASAPPSKKEKPSKFERDYGVSRGIDFQNVACVLNFDLPTSSKSYTHRIGRTARAGQTGMALSFAIPADLYGKHKPTTIRSARSDEKVLGRIISRQAKKGQSIKDYAFDMAQVEAFRYRMNDALRAVTRVAVREARAREIKQELVKSEKLRKHFEENPEDLKHLRHDGAAGGGGVVRVQRHLRNVPGYLMPKGGKAKVGGDEDGAVFAGFRNREGEERRKRRKVGGPGKGRKAQAGAKKGRSGKVDPLKNFRRK